MNISPELDKTERMMAEALSAEENFDITEKRAYVGKRRCVLFFADGFLREETLSKLLDSLYKVKPARCPDTAEKLMEQVVIFADCRVAKTVEHATESVLCGHLFLAVDGYEHAVIIDFRESLQRATTEPEKEKTARGSKDGFVEMILQNVALVRRRIRDPQFRAEFCRIGSVTRTDVVLCYIADRVDTKLLATVRTKLKNVKTEGLPMSQQTLSNLMMGGARFNPFPKFRYTERPDTACAQLLHGDVLIFVDNSPFATVLPVSLFDIMEDANDYYFPPVTGIYLRLVRYFTAFVTTFLTPLWLLVLEYADRLPEGLRFLLIREPAAIPVLAQLLLLEIAIDGLKLASLNTPTMMSTTMSVLAGVIIGDLALKTGWFCAESLFYMGFVALSNFSMPSYELSYALKFTRMVTLVLTSVFGLYGFCAGLVLLLAAMLFNKTFLGFRFLYPLLPFDGKKILKKARKMLGFNDPHGTSV